MALDLWDLAKVGPRWSEAGSGAGMRNFVSSGGSPDGLGGTELSNLVMGLVKWRGQWSWTKAGQGRSLGHARHAFRYLSIHLLIIYLLSIGHVAPTVSQPTIHLPDSYGSPVNCQSHTSTACLSWSYYVHQRSVCHLYALSSISHLSVCTNREGVCHGTDAVEDFHSGSR